MKTINGETLSKQQLAERDKIENAYFQGIVDGIRMDNAILKAKLKGMDLERERRLSEKTNAYTKPIGSGR